MYGFFGGVGGVGMWGDNLLYHPLTYLIINSITTCVGCGCVWGIIYRNISLLNPIVNGISTCVGVYGVCGGVGGVGVGG